MPIFVHISDLHFGREQPAVIEAWFRATQTIQPDLVIISGDLTQRATDEEYTAAQQFLAKLAWPYFVIPGNHDMSATDLPERFLKPWNKWQHSIGVIEPVLKTESYTLVGVCTAKTAGWYFDWSRGGISKEQMIAVQEKFQGGAAESLRVVVAHHPFWLPEQSEYRDLVTNRDAALEAFRAADVDLILSGHVHLPYTQLVQGVLIVHAGTTFSNRLSQNQPNSFNVLRGDQAQLSVDFMSWNGQSFQLVEQREFQKQAGVWKQIAGLNSV